MTKKQELLTEAKALGCKAVTRNSVGELEAMIAEAKDSNPKAPRGAKAGKTTEAAKANVDIAYLVTGIESGEFAKALATAGLTPSKLARHLEVEPAVVAKLASGKRTPRANAPADSIAGRVAAWYVKAVGA